jgi:hypothetical protein
MDEQQTDHRGAILINVMIGHDGRDAQALAAPDGGSSLGRKCIKHHANGQVVAVMAVRVLRRSVELLGRSHMHNHIPTCSKQQVMSYRSAHSQHGEEAHQKPSK